VVVKNLENGSTTTLPADAKAELIVTLLRNRPYSWRVISKSSESSATASSDTWKFYNSGPAETSHPPFSADALVPLLGANVTAVGGKVTLSWTGSDVDNDISSYDVFFGTTATPPLLQNITATTLEVTVTTNTVYYWRLVTKDAKGNTSQTGIFQFRVN
jgi:hypothetical protein